MVKLKFYLETSVWNFYFADDAPEKKEVTQIFFDNLDSSDSEIYISNVVLAEIFDAPQKKRESLLKLINHFKPIELNKNSNVDELSLSYLRHGVLTKKSTIDAQHIALAAVYEMDAIISWNMRHIANFRRQEKVRAVNLLNGYSKPIQLITPMEVAYGS